MSDHEHRGRHFEQETVCLDDQVFDNCTFDKCELIITGAGPYVLRDNIFMDCQFRFTGHAANTLAFLAMLHKSGAARTVEDLFNEIRGFMDHECP
jgi:hypothetical protein